eukprot:7783029-Heterocapsa_arctica.AAC.1
MPIQEHWRLPSEIEAWKSAAFRKGWTGVWHIRWKARQIRRSGHTGLERQNDHEIDASLRS